MKPIAKYRFAFFAFILIPFSGAAQNTTPSFTNYTTANGLCFNRVNDVLQDSRGFMWFGTAEGLSRFDGTNFKSFYADKTDGSSLPGNWIHHLEEYKKAHLVFISSGQAWCMNTITQQFYQCRELKDKTVMTIRKSGPGHYFLGSKDTCYWADSALHIVETIVPPTKLKNSTVSGVALTANTWLITNQAECFLYAVKTKTFAPFLWPEQMKALGNTVFYFHYYDKKNNCLYFSEYDHGLYRISLAGQLLHHWQTGSPEYSISDNAVLAITPFNDSTLLVGTQGNGFNYLNTRTNRVTRFVKKANNGSSFAGNGIQSVYLDDAKNTWLAATDGVSKLSAAATRIKSWRNQFNPVDQADQIQDITKGADGNIYASFYLSHTYRLSPVTNTVTLLGNAGMPGAWSLHNEGDDIYITGSGTSVIAYNTKTGHCKKNGFLKSCFPTSDVVVTGFKHSNGDVWYSGNLGGGFVRKEARSGTIHIYKKDGDRGHFLSSYYPCHTETANGDLWFGVNKASDLLHWVKATDSFQEVHLNTVPGTLGISFRGINSITADKESNIWIGFEGTGVVKYEPASNRTTHFTIQEGLPTNQVGCLRFDDKNRLWIGTAKGLSCLLPGERRFINFKKEDGLPEDVFEEGCIFFDTASRELWAGAQSTLMNFDPEVLLSKNLRQLPVYVDEVFVNSKKMVHDGQQSLQLSPAENNLQFQFIALDIDKGKELEYSYKMAGADKDWIYNGSITSASYANLQPGNYVFTIRAKHKGDNVWTEMKQPLSFSIQTPWNKRWWFLLLLSGATVSVAWFIISTYYTRKAEKQKAALAKQLAVSKERSRIAADMHDDMGAGLSRLRYLSAALKKEAPDEGKKREFDKLISGSDELVDKMNEIIWTLNSSDGHLEELLYYIRSQCSQLLDDANIRFRYSLPDSIPKTTVGSEQKRNLSLVVKEAVHNAIKHSGATQVSLEITLENGLRISIADNGNGFEPNRAKAGGNGLSNYQKRMTALNGTVAIQSGETGTTVVFQIPAI